MAEEGVAQGWLRSPAPSADRRPPRAGEEGFTLIELLIVLVILPLVIGAIAMVLITTLKNQQGIQGKVTDSTAATTASAYYVRDIESAASVTTAASPASAPPQCSASGLSGTPKLLLGLQLQGVSAVVSYYTLTPGAAHPSSCASTAPAATTTPTSHVVLSDNLSTSNPPTPVVNCITPTPTSIPTGVTCSPGLGLDLHLHGVDGHAQRHAGMFDRRVPARRISTRSPATPCRGSRCPPSSSPTVCSPCSGPVPPTSRSPP